MSINFDLLHKLAIEKRKKETDLSWNDIARICGVFGTNAGERARCLARTDNKKSHAKKVSAPTAAHNAHSSTKYTEYTPIMNISEEELNDALSAFDSTINPNGTITNSKLIELSEDDCKNSKVLLEKHGFNVNEFTLVSARNTMWNSASKNGDPVTLYSSKITVKPKDKTIASIEDVQTVFEDMCKTHVPPICEPCKKYNNSGKLLEINIADLHLGKYATMATTGNTYDTQKARELFFDVIVDIISKVQHYELEKILFVFSNDFFNFDTASRTTTSGTPQEYDITWQELFKVGCEMLVSAIEKLSYIAPVETFYVGANHDKQTAYYLICYLDAWFKHNPNVTVDTSPLSRKIRRFGKSLIYFMHGDMPKSQINGIIAREYPEEWGQTKFREIHAAHLHSDQSTIESCGCICRFLSSVTGTDIWHYESGFTGALAKSQSFIWDKEYGLEHIINTNIVK